jgi:hypothetical protein
MTSWAIALTLAAGSILTIIGIGRAAIYCANRHTQHRCPTCGHRTGIDFNKEQQP